MQCIKILNLCNLVFPQVQALQAAETFQVLNNLKKIIKQQNGDYCSTYNSEVTERSPTDIGIGNTWGFPLGAYCYIPLPPSLVYQLVQRV
jgi:hypothetical protein